MLRICIYQPNFALRYSGHRTQLTAYAQAAHLYGHSIVVISDYKDIVDFDIVHHFGCDVEIMKYIREHNRLSVMSTNLWTTYVNDQYASNVYRSVESAKRTFLGILRRYKCRDKSVSQPANPYDEIDALVVNSVGEKEELQRRFECLPSIYHLPNIVDAKSFSYSSVSTDGVLYVGRIEPHKNQLGFLKAVERIRCRATIIGLPHPHHPKYVERVLKLAERISVRVLPPLEPTELALQYASHKVHVLPSWYESTGLVSLEAGLVGNNVVHTKYGYGREYLQDYATYCDPGNIDSICEELQQNLKNECTNALSNYISKTYTVQSRVEEVGNTYTLMYKRQE